MAGPCCGVIGNVDVLEGNFVPIGRKKKREQFTNFANNPKLTVEDHVEGGFKSDKTSAALLYLQPLRSDKTVWKKVVEASPSSGYLPLSNPASQQRSLTVKKTLLEGSPNLEVLVHSDDANKGPSSGSIKHFDNSKEEHARPKTNDSVLKTFQDVVVQSTKVGPPEETIDGSRMLKNYSGVIGGNSYNSDGPAAQSSFSQPKEISISQAVNSYPRQAFPVPDRGRHLRRKENERIGDMHTNLPISDSCMGKEISRPCVSKKRINNMPYGHKQNNCHEDNEVNEHEIDGDSCLSSFTFSSTSSSFSSQEDKSSCMPLHSNGKKPHSKSLSCESTTSMLLLDDTEDMSTQNGMSTATYTVLTRRNFVQSALSKETERSYNGQVPVNVATSNKGNDCQADKVDAGELLFLMQEPEMQLNVQTLESDKLLSTEGKEMNFNNNDTTSPWLRQKLSQNDQSLVVNADNFELPHNKKESTSLNCAYTCVGKRSPRKTTFKPRCKRWHRNSCSAAGLMWGKPQDTTLHLGVGIGILYMLVASRKEVERLNKLLDQTDSLVQDIKQHLQCEMGFFPNFSSQTGSSNLERSENQKQKATEGSQTSQDELIVEVCDARLQPKYQNVAETSVESISEDTHMAELEAALEAELELMQLNLASESISNDQASTEDFSEWNSSLSINEPTSPGDGLAMTFDGDKKRVYPFHEEVQNINFAVSPGALSRRLHEVLETRQEDQILELEAQLEATRTSLAVKERELQSWKDIFQQLIQPSHGNSGDDAETNTINKGKGSFSVDQDFSALNVRAKKAWETLDPQVQCNSLQSELKTATQKLSYSKSNSFCEQSRNIKTVDIVPAPASSL